MSDKPFHVEVKLDHPNAVVSKVRLDAGAETPIHAHAHGYVVHPRAASKLLKTTYQNGEKQSEQPIEHKAGEPYFVAASQDGITFSLKNIGDGPMLCDKTFIRPD